MWRQLVLQGGKQELLAKGLRVVEITHVMIRVERRLKEELRKRKNIQSQIQFIFHRLLSGLVDFNIY